MSKILEREKKGDRYIDDVDRLAERIWNDFGEDIIDIDSYNKYFNKYMGEMTNKQKISLRRNVFDSIRKEHPSVVAERIYKKAGRISKEAEIIEDKRVKPKFTHLSYVKHKVVYAKEERLTYKIKQKEITRTIYRDRLGRFASTKSLRERKKVKVHKIT